MSIIREMQDPRTVMLTVTQKGVLGIIKNSPTPETAFESINGSPALVTARNLLERLGLIRIGGNKAGLTPDGEQALIANNISDETGQITDEGGQLIDQITGGRASYNVVEQFTLIKQITRVESD